MQFPSTTTAPLGQQILRWSLFSLLSTTLVYSLLFIFQWLFLPGFLTWGLHIELYLFFFFVGLTGIARRRMKNVALSRQLIDLMSKTLTNPDAATQQQLQQLNKSTQIQLGFAILIHRITSLLVKLILLILLIHTLLLVLLSN